MLRCIRDLRFVRITNLDEQQEIALFRITISESEVGNLHRFLELTYSDLCEGFGNITHGRRPSVDRLDVWVRGVHQ